MLGNNAASKKLVESDQGVRAFPLLSDGRKNFIIGLDECICRLTKGTSGKLLASDVMSAHEIKGSKDWVNDLVEKRHFVCFFTHRPERLRKATERWLANHGYNYDSLVMGKPVAKNYHYIDDRHVQATTFGGRYSQLVRKQHQIQVFE